MYDNGWESIIHQIIIYTTWASICKDIYKGGGLIFSIWGSLEETYRLHLDKSTPLFRDNIEALTISIYPGICKASNREALEGFYFSSSTIL